MTIKEIQIKIYTIQGAVKHKDYEVAHALEDELNMNFVTDIYEGNTDDMRTKAKLIHFIRLIDFPRNCS